MRKCRITFRLTRMELDEFFQYARARGHNVSYFIREALKDAYPDIFCTVNRYIRKPRKRVKPIPERTKILTSYADGSVKVIDPDD